MDFERVNRDGEDAFPGFTVGVGWSFWESVPFVAGFRSPDGNKAVRTIGSKPYGLDSFGVAGGMLGKKASYSLRV